MKQIEKEVLLLRNENKKLKQKINSIQNPNDLIRKKRQQIKAIIHKFEQNDFNQLDLKKKDNLMKINDKVINYFKLNRKRLVSLKSHKFQDYGIYLRYHCKEYFRYPFKKGLTQVNRCKKLYTAKYSIASDTLEIAEQQIEDCEHILI